MDRRTSSPTSVGLKLTLLASYATVPLRAFINSLASDGRVLLATQLLDAMGAGLCRDPTRRDIPPPLSLLMHVAASTAALAGVINFLTVVTFESLSRGSDHFAFLQGVGLACSGIGMAVSISTSG